MNKKSLWKLILILAIPCIIGFMPAPAGLSELAWVLFGIYLAAIVGLVIKPFPEPVVLLIAVAASMVVVGNLSDGAFKTTAVLSGYSSGTTWLVFSAFTLSAAFVTTGLGKRIAYLLIGKIGNTTYSAAIFLIPICISFDTAEKRRYATYLILNRRFSFEF